jgi:predicted ATPase/tetratricopeptide (TPR) repeat protein
MAKQSGKPHSDSTVHNSDDPPARVEIAHVLFMDLVGYSRLPLEEQNRRIGALQEVVRAAPTYRRASDGGDVLSHPAGDGLALAFFHDPSTPAQCALEVAAALRDRDDLPLRMGVHSGPVYRAEDINDTANVRGPGINVAQRVMDCGDARHILISYTTADVLGQLEAWATRLHDIGEVEVKHGLRLRLYNLVDGDLGVATIPSKALPSPDDSAAGAPLHNLPAALTSFIGRERQIDEVARRLAGTRLLTLSGTGGAGKTRLALRVGESVADEHPDGVWLVELAPLTDPALIPATLAEVLGVGADSDQPMLAVVTQHLAKQRALIILDNCEHLVDGAAEFAQALLQACPNPRILATSRELLGIPGEAAWPVPTLSLPDGPREAEDTVGADAASGYEAVRLFVERAEAARPDFALTDDNVAVVIAICRRLDGIPLAIELAAARVRVMSLDQIRERLDDRFRLLTGGGRASPRRQQTLRALIDWSYHLLDPPQQAVFARLALFGGGFTLEAAEEVCAFGDVDAWDVMDLTLQLVDRSLIVVDEGPVGPRYRMLESLREYGCERAVDTGDADEARRQHARFYARHVADATAEGCPEDAPPATQLVEAERGNIRQALTWALTGDVRLGMDMVRDLSAPWEAAGAYVEGQDWRGRYLPLAASADPSAIAAVRSHSASAHYAQREFDLATRDGERALAEFDALGDERGAARVSFTLGQAANLMGDADVASRRFERAKVAFSDDPDSWMTWGIPTLQAFGMADRGDYAAAWEQTEDVRRTFTDSHLRMGPLLTMVRSVICRLRGEYEDAQRHLDEAQERVTNGGDLTLTRVTLWYQGELSLAQRDYATAYGYYGERLALERRLGARSPAASCLARQGLAAMRLDRFDAARGHYAEAVEAFSDIDDPEGVLRANLGLAAVDISSDDLPGAAQRLASCLPMATDLGEDVAVAEYVDACAWLIALRGRPDTGVRLAAAASSWEDPSPSGHAFGDAAILSPDDFPAALRPNLGDAAYENAAKEGATMTLTEALAAAATELST